VPTFRWNDWNRDHAGRHGVELLEAERVVENGDRRRIDDDKYKVIGRGTGGRWVQVIYIFDPPGVVYVIHARPLTDAEKRRARRNQR
jgi:uncharacterized DUF497 family protein